MHDLSGSYNLFLVILSLAIATIAAFSAIEMSNHALHGSARSRFRILTIAALVMGIGIWSMHFVGMLAFSLPVHVTYTAPIVLLSVAPAIIGSGIALFLVNRTRLNPLLLLGAGTILGAGIGGMHYVGMYAMHMQADLRFDLITVAASVVIAVVASSGALFALTQAIQDPEVKLTYNAFAAICMGLGITGLHYVAMQAAHFTENLAPLTGGLAVDISTLGTAAIVIITVALSSLTTIVTRASRAAMAAKTLAASAAPARQFAGQ